MSGRSGTSLFAIGLLLVSCGGTDTTGDERATTATDPAQVEPVTPASEVGEPATGADELSRDRVDRVTELVDTWHDGVNAGDVEAVLSIFAADGAVLDQDGAVVVDSHAALAEVIREVADFVDYRRVSEVTEMAVGTYSFVQQFVDELGDTRRAVVVFEVADGLVSRVQWVSEFVDTGTVARPTPRTATADLTTPAGRRVPTFNARPEHLALTEWGLTRYSDAGLAEPPVHTFVFPPSEECRNVSGSTVNEADGIAVHLCFAAEEICRDTDCTTFDRAARRTVLHELAHAWETVALEASTRSAFLQLRGLEHWFDDPLWGYRGSEQAAEVLAWGLLDEATEPVKLPDQRSCTELLDAYRLLTGTEPLRTRVCIP